jgi:hypothetical protein
VLRLLVHCDITGTSGEKDKPLKSVLKVDKENEWTEKNL